MEVTHREDHVTHAVIGGGESISMGITDDAMFMHMLSSTLYSDKILAVVRESICNAWDAHIEAKRVDKPIQITLTQEKLVIRDFGLGIHHSQIGPIYGTYGASTKKHDGKQTGGFGLGCKSPFAYADHFEVVSCHDGIKTVYRMTKSSAELNGKPGIVPLLSIPTDDEGLTMSLNIKDRIDFMRFNALIRRIVANGEINAELNGESLPIIEFSQMQHGYVITKAKVLENHSRICLRYGNVIYPLESHDQYKHDYDRTVTVLDTLGSYYGDYCIILQAKPNTLSITPSRESLSMEEKTIQTVATMLKKFLHAHNSTFHRECLELVKVTNESYIAKGKAHVLLSSPTSKNLCENPSLRRRTDHLITDTAQAASSYLAIEYPKEAKFPAKDMLHRLTLLKNSGLYDKGLVHTFRTEFRRQQCKGGEFSKKSVQWFQRHVVAPLVVPMKGTSLQTNRLMVYASTSSIGGWGHSNQVYDHGRYYPRSMYGLLPFLRQLVVLTHSQKNINDRVRRVPDWSTKYGKDAGFMVYVVPRTSKKIDEAREFFSNRNVVLIDLTLVIEKREAVVREAVIKKPKVKGYPTLAAAKKGDHFCQYMAKEATDDEDRVEKPLFYTYLYAKSDKYSSQKDLPSLDRRAAQIVCKLWGDKGAVVFTELAANTLSKKGVPTLAVFLVEQMGAFLKTKDVHKYLGSSVTRMDDISSGKNAAATQAITRIQGSALAQELLKLGSTLVPEKKDMLRLWAEVSDRDSMSALRPLVRAVPVNKKLIVIVAKLEASKSLPFFNFDHYDSVMGGRNAEAKEYAVKQLLKTLKD